MKLFCLLSLGCLLLTGCGRDTPLFEKLSPSQTNITFTNQLDESPDFNVLQYGYFYNGGGVAAGDFNNDGRIDLYFTGNLNANKLYLNRTKPGSGALTFDDVTDRAGVGAADGWNTGVSVVDINADGWLDLYVCRSAAVDARLRRNLLFINNKTTDGGIPTFTEQAAAYGLADPGYSTQAAFFDYDRDGDLDCFLLNHSVQAYAGFSRMLASHRQQTNPNYASKLYQNQQGRFVDVSATAGLTANVLSFGLACAVSDFNDDGWLDLYVSNDYNENDYLYVNQQNGQFREVVRSAMGHTSLYSMGNDAADINNDGRIDLLTLDMLPERNERIKLTAGDDNYDKYEQLMRAGFHHQTMRNMVQLNVGSEPPSAATRPASTSVSNPVFAEIGQLAGVSNTDWSWAGLFADFDNDGWKDLFVTNGYARDYTNMEFLKFTMDEQLKSRQTGVAADPMAVIAKMPGISEPNYIFRNTGQLTFANKTVDWGFDTPTQSNGAVYADLDNDGDLDLAINNVNARADIYQNHSERSPTAHSLTVQLRSPNPAALPGARVTVWTGNHAQTQEFQPVRGFQSAMYGPLVFGLGATARADSVQIRWADGTRQAARPAAGRTMVVDYRPAGRWVAAAAPAPIWSPAHVLTAVNREDTVNDFNIQPLLPYMLSRTGARFATADCNGDGADDLFVGGGRGQGGQVFVQQNGRFGQTSQPALTADRQCEDAGAVWFDADGDRDLDLAVCSAGYDLPVDDARLAVRLYRNDGRGHLTKSTSLPDVRVSASCVRAADVDRDGDLDLFVGARVVPGRYPALPPSHLLLNTGNGQFVDSPQPVLRTLGMVTDAAFADLNRDGAPELVVSTDFGPIQTCTFQNGRLALARSLSPTPTGCWHRLLVQDVDSDGDLDILAANDGQNSQFRATPAYPLTLFGVTTTGERYLPVLASYEQSGNTGRLYPFNARDELLDQISSLRRTYTDYTSYARATVQDLFASGDLNLEKAQQLHADELRTVLFRNDGGRFSTLPLPAEAQFAPAYALALTDVNADGRPDLLIGGNRDQNRVRIGRADANRGQLFLNRGNGQFAYVPMPRSGLCWSGDVRDLAVVRRGGETTLLVGRIGEPVLTYDLN